MVYMALLVYNIYTKRYYLPNRQQTNNMHYNMNNA